MKAIQFIKGVLNSFFFFFNLSGLTPNPSKSTLFCLGISNVLKNEIKGCLHMEEDKLSVRYLQVSSISKKFSDVDYDSLIGKIAGRILLGYRNTFLLQFFFS
jgi:hypothetical protein